MYLVRVTSPYVATTQLLPTVPALNPYTVFGNNLITSVPIKTDTITTEQQQQQQQQQAINSAAQWATTVGYDEKQIDYAQTLMMNSQYAAALSLGGNFFPGHTAALVKAAKQDHMASPTRISPILLQQNTRRFTPY
ncbi:unnamed protein product [Brugia pahangi]|uniref:MBNL3 n=1 Tax=Brugia pahangi TaxID=6280 RepID=A0A0N4TM12_BRUPA|nr:unnamed protein product [Brugia pahangi]